MAVVHRWGKEMVLAFVQNGGGLFWGLCIVCAWFFYFVPSGKRLHDRDKSAWWLLLAFIPVVGWFFLFIELAFLKGTSASNDYGPASAAERKQDVPAWRTGQKPTAAPARTILIRLETPLAEDELVIMDLVKAENRDIQAVFVSPRRNEVRFQLAPSSHKTEKTMIKILKNLGIT